MDFEDFILYFCITMIIILSTLSIIGIFYGIATYGNKSEVEKCMDYYKDYSYCQRYEREEKIENE